MPPRWEMGLTPENEIYFMNHTDRSTTWYDPRLPQSQQPQVPHRIVCEGSNNGHGNGQPIASPAAQPNQINQKRLQMLLTKQHENRQRQEEVLRLQQNRLNRGPGVDVMSAQEMLMRSSLSEPGSDPYLPSANNEIHNRQESADSGLGMGSNFNLGSIPEDISGIESMDTGDLDTTLTGDINNPVVSAANATPSSANPSQRDASADHLLTSLPSDLGEMPADLMESFLDSNQPNTNNPNPIWL